LEQVRVAIIAGPRLGAVISEEQRRACSASEKFLLQGLIRLAFT